MADMIKLSSEVAFLDADGNVDRVKDLGSDPLNVRDDGRVKPVVRVMPEGSEDEIVVFDRYEVAEDHVKAIYKTNSVPLAKRVAAVEANVAKIMAVLKLDPSE